jgi:glycosyltransferase involved in cell wall biosynthesis
VIVPAYNEERSLPVTLRELRSVAPDLDVVVIDDGSADGTGEAARVGAAELVTLPFNVGVGGAVRAGLRFAQIQGYQRAVVLDADGQHDPASIGDLLAALDAGADMAVGSRFSNELGGYGVGGLRKRAMRFLSLVVRVITGQRFTDTTSGFRAFDREVIELLARDYPAEYLADTVEALLLVLYAGHRVVEVATPMRPRTAGRPSTRRLALVANYLRLLIGILGSASRRARRTPPTARST